MFVALLQVSANSYSQTKKLTLVGKNLTLEKVFELIEDQSEFSFLYNLKQVDLSKEVDVDFKNEQVEKILNHVLEGSNITYTLDNRLIVIHKGKEFGLNINADETQQKTVSGKVTDSSSSPLPGVTVVVKGTTQGTVTNADGNYSLSNIPEDATLVFSFVGMKTQEVVVGSHSTINIAMEEETIGIEEVVAIGYGTQSRELLTTSISKIDTIAFENIPYTNAANVLQGTTSGVRVTSTSGQPGSAPLVIVRGGTSLDPNGSYPLYVIDGIISPDMTSINPQDIESVQVLKDAASTAIYGARGSNGVVLITTKSAKKGEAVINYSYDISFSNYKSRLEMLSARDFIYYNRLGIAQAMKKWPFFEVVLGNASSAGTGNDLSKNTFYTTQYLTSENEHKLNEGWESMPDPLDESKTIIFKGTDWRDVMFQTSVSHNHNISASGGTDKATYRISLGYLDNDGITIKTGYKRLTLDMKGSVKLSDNLTVSSSAQYFSGRTNGVYHESQLFGRMLQVAPTLKYEFEDGTLAWGPTGNKGNPEYRLNITPQSSLNEQSDFTLGASWEILPNLSFNPKVSLLKRAINSWSFTKSNYNGNNYDESRYASETNKRYYARQADGIFSYSKSINNGHDLNITAGLSFLENEENYLSATGRGAATDLIRTLNASAIPVSISSSQTVFRYMGYFGRANYNYRGKYLASLSVRYDGASNLGDNYKWGTFPGVSLGWNLHNEKFWNESNLFISKLKLRTSYGINGNTNALGAYQAQGSYSVGAKYDGIGGVINTVLENPELRWEEAKTFDVGLDLGFFKNKVNIIFDAYRRVTDNLLSSRTLPHATGFGSIITNLGSVENKGYDIEINLQPLSSSKALKWNLALNASYVKNKILTLPPNGAENNRIGGIYIWDDELGDYAWKGGLQEGGTMGELYGYKQVGLYSSDEDAANAGITDILIEGVDKVTKFGGDAIFEDRDENNIIDEKDRSYMGNIYPKWTGGAINSLFYKNFYLILRLDYATGHTIYNYMRATTTGQFAGDLGLSADAGRSWLKPGDEKNTNIPRLYYGDWQSNLLRGNSIMFEKGNYLSIRELTLSYEIPSKILEKYGISNLRFNLSGQNLHYFTNYKGINPEFGGTDNGSYPISANYILGASITF
jgi:TonB-linked SusC/RagA family outer membrane protein